ncbi:Aldo/keto reductase subgroup [Penicillium cf. griseofulvum]|uniref:D-xylose reductase [NAD(P)H] n=1 Tax=Penicillium cf. griseofulvum TaxID=2972120 RepID=A0A9W9JFQ3_9EURO|nr:Aldo/keto reductase subgroup [Penicillium cf. griseofulvum]KAJ5445383.1 Aldo/keto reductase subgroup [Penicillium cf. griseofulvum]KAJ5447102.1 Aldo/keto reductase subgroup [Penicillium cf. griseofulvum]
MAACDTRFKLNTGAEIPALGLGTWQSQPGEVARAVFHAIKVGYRHIDAALCYGNENEVGQGIKEAIDTGIVKREDLFVTTKLWCSYHARVEEGLEQSLKDLGLDYVDLYLMHWPLAMNPKGNHNIFPKLADGSRDIIHSHSHVTTWKSMEKLVGTGKVKAIGVSNYSVKYLEELLPQATIVPAANQIENHPLLPQQEIVDFCNQAGIHITAYSPLGSTGSPLFTAEPIVAVAEKRGVTPATVLLSWHIARGSSVLAKSVTPARIEANRTDLIHLDVEDMAALRKYSDGLEAEGKLQRFVYPPFGINFGFPDKQ